VQGVGGSNPLAPTKKSKPASESSFTGWLFSLSAKHDSAHSIEIDVSDANESAFMNPHRILFFAAIAAMLAACAPLKPHTTLPVDLVKSPNFDLRRPNFVILHHTSDDTLQEALQTLTSPLREVSAHYLIGRDGSIVQLVEENARAWHAGKSWWAGQTDVNSASLGIELDNNGYESFSEPQITALLTLLADIRQRYKIPAANFLGHADVAPSRKNDPSALFPWQTLAQYGFGLWCDQPVPPAPPGFNLQFALAAIGYDPATPEASRRAFRLHFIRSDVVPSEDEEKALAYCLLQKKASPAQ
jgi:N-acetylmuramoyl-L-alanine amidase